MKNGRHPEPRSARAQAGRNAAGEPLSSGNVKRWNEPPPPLRAAAYYFFFFFFFFLLFFELLLPGAE